MAIIDKNGKIVANTSQPFRIFTSLASYTAWVATLPLPADVNKFAIIKDWGGNIILQVNGSSYDLASGVLVNFAASTDYSQYEMIYKDRILYRAKVKFTSAATFNVIDWEVVATSEAVIKNFTPSTTYTKDTAIYYNGAIYRAKVDFTSTATFTLTNWERLTNDEIYTYNAIDSFPIKAIVAYGEASYLTLSAVPAGTAITNTTYYKPVGSVLREFSQAEWTALTIKPMSAIINDSLFDA